jgi:hypothetical protein
MVDKPRITNDGAIRPHGGNRPTQLGEGIRKGGINPPPENFHRPDPPPPFKPAPPPPTPKRD